MKIKIDWDKAREEVKEAHRNYGSRSTSELWARAYHRQLEPQINQISEQRFHYFLDPARGATKPETCDCSDRKVLEKYKYIWEGSWSGNWYYVMRTDEETVYMVGCITKCPCCNKPLP